MTVRLSPSWYLSDVHVATSYGWPVLVNRETDEAYGPRDVVQLYPSHEATAAMIAVKRLAETLQLTITEQAMVERFTQ